MSFFSHPPYRCVCLLAVLVGVAFPAMAEPPRSIEVLGHFGSFRVGGDEGWGGTSPAYGLTGTIPLTPRWAFETDFVRTDDEEWEADGTGFRERRIMTLLHFVYRRGSERVYWFGGGGVGFQNLDRRVRVALPGPPESFIGTREFHSESNDFSPLGYKTGVVVSPTKHFIIRGEILFQHIYVLPNTMARVGVGWRF